MKLLRHGLIQGPAYVAPLAGAWIETEMDVKLGAIQSVAPLAGAWIETPI